MQICFFRSNVLHFTFASQLKVLATLANLLLSPSVVSNSLWPHGLQHVRLPYPSPSPRVYSNSCPLSRWCHPLISFSIIPFSCLQSFPASVFPSEAALGIRWPEYWTFIFSIIPSSEYSGLISFRIDWFDLLAVQRTLKSLLQHPSWRIISIPLKRLPWWLSGKEPTCQAGNMGSFPALGRSPGGGNSNPLQYSLLFVCFFPLFLL